jgi:regulator of sigma E protease
MIQLLQFVGALSLMVILHEMGHYIAARIFGVRVEKFYLFFNPGFTLFKYTSKKSGTEYGIGWLPFGGYVKLSGMIDESLDTQQMQKEPAPYEFRAKPAWQRLIIMAGGVFMNFLTAVIVYAMLLFAYGKEYVALDDAKYGMAFSEVAQKHGFVDGDKLLMADGVKLESLDYESMKKIFDASEVTVLRGVDTVQIPVNESLKLDLVAEQTGFASFRCPFVVKEVMEMSPAKLAGLQPGDSVVAMNGVATPTHQEANVVLKSNKLAPISIEYIREGNLCTTTATPDSAGMLGVYLTPYFELLPLTKIEYGFFESFPLGLVEGSKMFTGYADDLKIVFTPEGASSIGGFGSLAGLFPDAFSAQYFWTIIAYLSVVLAFMNLLPIPGLDGGHILFLLVECIRRKPLSQKFMVKAQIIGMILLFALLFYANGMDLIRWLG